MFVFVFLMSCEPPPPPPNPNSAPSGMQPGGMQPGGSSLFSSPFGGTSASPFVPSSSGGIFSQLRGGVGRVVFCVILFCLLRLSLSHISSITCLVFVSFSSVFCVLVSLSLSFSPHPHRFVVFCFVFLPWAVLSCLVFRTDRILAVRE